MARASGTRRVMLVVGGIVAVVGLLVGGLWLAQRSLIYLPDTAAPDVPTADAGLPGLQEVGLPTADGLDLRAWYVPAPPSGCRATVLVAPGNAGNRAGRLPLARALADSGFGVLLLDYRGYGGNPGSPTETGLILDARAARAFLVDAQGLDPREILYFGESLGSAVVTGLAVTDPPAGLLLRSPFVDLAAAAAVHYPILPVRSMLWDSYPVAAQVAGLSAPVTVVYGTADTVIPPEQSREVAAAAGERAAVVAVDGADHNDRALLDGPAIVDAMLALAERAGCVPGG